MTNMKRITVSFPDDTTSQLEQLKRTEQFAGRPYSELIRYLVSVGIRSQSKNSRKI